VPGYDKHKLTISFFSTEGLMIRGENVSYLTLMEEPTRLTLTVFKGFCCFQNVPSTPLDEVILAE